MSVHSRRIPAVGCAEHTSPQNKLLGQKEAPCLTTPLQSAFQQMRHVITHRAPAVPLVCKAELASVFLLRAACSSFSGEQANPPPGSHPRSAPLHTRPRHLMCASAQFLY